MSANESVVFNRPIRALRLPDSQCPIVLSALETRPDHLSATSMGGIAIRIYATHAHGGDYAEIYVANPPESTESQQTYHTADNYWGEN